MTTIVPPEDTPETQARIKAIMDRTERIRSSKPRRLDYRAVLEDYRQRARGELCLT